MGKQHVTLLAFVFSHLPLPFGISVKPRISKGKPHEACSLWSELLCQACFQCWTSRAAFPQEIPPSSQRQLRPRNPRPLSSQLQPRSIRRHQCSTSTSCQCRSSSTAHLLPPSWRSQATRRRSLPLRQPMISSTRLHPTNPKTQLPNLYAQQRSPAPRAYCLQQSKTRCPGRILGLLAFFQDLEAQLRCLVLTEGRTFYFSSC